MQRSSTFAVGAAVAVLAIVATTSPARAAEPDAALAAFGRPRSVIVGVTAAAAHNQEMTDLSYTNRGFGAELVASMVFAHGWSLGADVPIWYGRTSVPDGSITSTTVGVEARGGRLTTLTPLVSWWPQLGAGYMHTTSSNSDPTVTVVGSSGGTVMADLEAPLLLHPGAHFFVAAGPGVQLRFSSDTQTATLVGRLSLGWCL
jgi:hypothetical protein